MLSKLIEKIFENQRVKRTPVLNSILWTFCFLRPMLDMIARNLDNLLFPKKEKQGISLI
jgi:hypothetical protein